MIFLTQDDLDLGQDKSKKSLQISIDSQSLGASVFWLLKPTIIQETRQTYAVLTSNTCRQPKTPTGLVRIDKKVQPEAKTDKVFFNSDTDPEI